MAEGAAKGDFYIGVDLGGTKILAGVFDSQLTCLGRNKISTKPERGADEVIERIARCARDAMDECDLDLKQLRGVGVGAPGAIDVSSGRVIFAPNLQWQDVPLKKAL
jgi:glucokinase